MVILNMKIKRTIKANLKTIKETAEELYTIHQPRPLEVENGKTMFW